MQILPRTNFKVNTFPLALDMAREFIAKHPIPLVWDEDQMRHYLKLLEADFLKRTSS